MDPFLAPDHPIQELLFWVPGDVDERIRTLCEDLVDRLANKREWMISPPEYVDSRQDPAEVSPGDMPIVTVGGVLKMYTTYPPPWELPRAVDLRRFAEVTTVLDELQGLSSQEGIPFELELDGEFVGLISDGEFDRALKDVFLGEWKRNLENT